MMGHTVANPGIQRAKDWWEQNKFAFESKQAGKIFVPFLPVADTSLQMAETEDNRSLREFVEGQSRATNEAQSPGANPSAEQ